MTQSFVDLHHNGQSAPHPHYAKHAVTEVGPGAGKQAVRGHTRDGRPVAPHFRAKFGGNASNPMAPPATPNEPD